jgi:putative two-component system hydrogenase maturation factor HypX/HoxX
MGGRDYWSNGIHLTASKRPNRRPTNRGPTSTPSTISPKRSLHEKQLSIAALQGNCGAGGCFLARAADLVWARAGVLLNPHYRNMGNLYGSEYWTYLLPARVGVAKARRRSCATGCR